MKTLIVLASAYCIVMAGVVVAKSEPASKRIRVALVCFATGEQVSGGMTKICYYDCLGSPVAITVGATQLCPLSINR